MSATGPERLAEVIAARGIRDQRLLAAVRELPRADFVPPEETARADQDVPVPIPHRQVTTQPSLIAQMIAALELSPGDVVLEVGTGFGYQTALLARLGGEVHSVDRWADLVETARANLARHGITDVDLVHGDGTEGLPDAAPFDAVVVSAAFPDVPAALTEQLREGGRLVQPIGTGGHEDVCLFRRHAGRLQRVRSLTPARFVTGVRGRPPAQGAGWRRAVWRR